MGENQRQSLKLAWDALHPRCKFSVSPPSSGCASPHPRSMLDTLGVLLNRNNMHRLTARFLLLFALAGTFVPLALAATAASPHACCVRKSAHQCHGSAVAGSDQLVVRSAACCNRDCGRAVVTSQWANPQPRITNVFARSLDTRVAESHPEDPAAEFASSQSTRAPPAC